MYSWNTECIVSFISRAIGVNVGFNDTFAHDVQLWKKEFSVSSNVCVTLPAVNATFYFFHYSPALTVLSFVFPTLITVHQNTKANF